ncbi:hypothetical protein MBLNU457_1631t1 [Dothideomycetes sp. NU457]
MSSQQLHTSLLRTPVAQILRAAGFNSTKPSVLDTVVDITERYLLLLASTTAAHAQSNHNSPQPTITDVRMALTDCGVLLPTITSAEEEWKERFRRPYEDFDDLPYGATRREKELKKREEEDTGDVREFTQWITGDRNKEIRRIAGMLPETGAGVGVGGEMQALPEDYLTALKKKNARTGQEERYAGTVLGKDAEDREIRIEGGPVENLRDWAWKMIEEETKKAREKQAEEVKDGEVTDEEMQDAPT